MSARAQWACLLPPLAAAAVLIMAYGGVQARWYLPVDAALLVAAAAWAARQWQHDAAPRWAALDVALLAVLLLPLIQLTAGTTVNRAATETAFVGMLAAGCAFFLAAQAGRDGGAGRARLPAIFAVAGGALAAAAMVQFSLFPDRIWGLHQVLVGSPVGSFVNHDDFAACMELLLPAGLAMVIQARAAVRALAWAAAPGLMTAAVVMSASRGGAFCVALEWAAFAVYCLRTRQTAAIGRRRALVALAVVLVVLGYSLAAGFAPLVRRLRQAPVDAQLRWQLATASAAMGAARPVMGWGLGAWPYVYPRYQRFDDGLRFGAAHSDWMQWWAETGLVGELLLLALALTYLRTWYRGSSPLGQRGPAKRLRGREHRAWAELARRSRAPCEPATAAFRIATAAFVLHAALDFVLHIPALLILFSVVAALAVEDEPSSRSPSEPVSRAGSGKRPAWTVSYEPRFP